MMVQLNGLPGAVIRDESGNFWTRCPQCLEASPLYHQVTYHEDHTVTVVPSIVCGCGAHFLIERSVVRFV